ncbi:unnamed protein product, partial [marine sediment metagenome]
IDGISVRIKFNSPEECRWCTYHKYHGDHFSAY